VSRPTVIIELAGDAQFSRDLAAGGVFVSGCTLQLTEECDLVVRGTEHQIVVPARVVFIDEQGGAGLELIGFSTELKAQLADLTPVAQQELEVEVPVLEEFAFDDARFGNASIDGPAAFGDRPAVSGIIEVPLIDLVALDDSRDEDRSPAGPAGRDRAPNGTEAYPGGPDDLPAVEGAGDAGGPEARAPGGAPRSVHERLRGLTLAAQVKLASSGELHERMVLERLYGKTVWEALLRNPRLTPPEVSRIARYGSLPRVLLEIIVGDNTWLQIPEVRRALLSNPRLAPDQIHKVLRVTPKHELKLVAAQPSYPHAVRNAARMMLRDD
jgi:hypothetical protein